MFIERIKRFMCIFIIKLFYVNGYRVFDVNGVETILALQNEEILLDCKSHDPMPMAYCGFVHPTGKRYAFSGPDLDNGRCFIKIKATRQDNGMWECHMGKKTLGLEVMHRMEVRTVGYLAAVEKNVSAVHRNEITLKCVSTVGLTSLSYCRFEPPHGAGPFSLDSTVDTLHPIQKRFFFPSNHSLNRGDCAVTIRKVKFEDVGHWTCGAGFEDGKEHIDVISLEVEGLYAMSTASVTGISFGVVAIILILGLVGIMAWNKRSMLGSRQNNEIEEIEIPERRPMTPQRSRPSSPAASMQRTPLGSPRGSPRLARIIPELMIQSPSEPSTTSPFMRE